MIAKPSFERERKRERDSKATIGGRLSSRDSRPFAYVTRRVRFKSPLVPKTRKMGKTRGVHETTPELRNRMVGMYEAGLGLREIAAAVNCSVNKSYVYISMKLQINIIIIDRNYINRSALISV